MTPNATVPFPLEIAFQDMDRSDAVEARIRERVQRLERFHQRITAGRVVVKRGTARHHKGNIYEVRVDITVPGKQIVVNREPGDRNAHEDVYVAVRDAFAATTRQLEDYVRKSSGHGTKIHHVPHQGLVERLFAEEGYGFIRTPDGREIYFHRNSLDEGGWQRIDVGSHVRFTEEPGEKGPHAHNVTPLD
ncbi:MAG: HPF/RaiA family ribosome-associated protein [Alphaproteobacteria bacterium]|nr:HPF/RaiA family ribosome-associated protein [Alphaproteobacteria bacterium]